MSRTRAQSKALIRDILRLDKQGLLQRDIAKRLGCTQGTVSSVLINHGVRRYPARNAKTDRELRPQAEVVKPGVVKVKGNRY